MTTARLVRAIRSAWRVRWQFLITFLVIFFVSLSALLWFDLVPDPPKTADSNSLVATSTPIVQNALAPNASDVFAHGEEPVRIQIPSIGLNASVSNPSTTDAEQLDQYLLKGAVRYPTSGLLGANGNVVLFGHSSYLPIVSNLAYKTFDGIQKLHAGDLVTVYSSERAYTYAVDTVNKEDANSAAIPLTVSGQELTLSTCDSFASKSDRFVVTAHYVNSSPL